MHEQYQKPLKPPKSWKPTYDNHSPIGDWDTKAERVKQAFRHAYHAYEKFASPADELLPLTGRKIDNFNGWGVTVVDSLDTMYLMGLQDEFNTGLTFVERMNFTANDTIYIPFFETNIRYLGGLLSAYALSQDSILLERAEELGHLLLPAFNTTSGFPVYSMNIKTGLPPKKERNQGSLAEIATCQMEYKYLAHLTGKKEFYDVAQKVTASLYNAKTDWVGGMFPTQWDLKYGSPVNDVVSIGSLADSAYEYLLKQWLLTGKSEKESLEMYVRQANLIIENLLYLSPTRGLLYVSDVLISKNRPPSPSHRFEHLSCFLPGLLALGAHTLPPAALSDKQRERHWWAAEGLAYSCWMMYADQETGLGPEEVLFNFEGPGWHERNRWVNALRMWEEDSGDVPPPGLTEVQPVRMEDPKQDYWVNKLPHLLRPETIESMYIMWRLTGNAKWRERGWKVFEALEKEAKVGNGYAVLASVLKSPAKLQDSMPSYFLAETLKYLYLLFTDKDIVPLDRFVLNTEAHPLPVFNWTMWDKKNFKIL
ncbi:seven-hairpin glycosidase [Rickenella mellea]|uniref:alpha-1,2-Mannosidase n=1 Tax=Rickenella mellea TaxID=50990 RepID=A0A4Y7Q123_9AGAM|nr:seven-hairpin glycosidase [Rickenella mellea]